MKNCIIAGSLIASILLFAACRKNDGQQASRLTLIEVFAELAPAARKASIDATMGGSIYAQGGTRVIIPPAALRTAGGADVTGMVQVEVNDWLKKGDMIFGNMLPVDLLDSPLVSGGQGYVGVTQNGQPVYLKPGMTIQMNFPQFGHTQPGMSYYRGIPGGAGAVMWLRGDSLAGLNRVIYLEDTLSLFSDDFTYVNCDHSFGMPQYSYSVTLNSADGHMKDTAAYLLIDQLRTVVRLRIAGGGVLAGTAPALPAHLVVAELRDGAFYAGIIPVSITSGTNKFTVTMTKTDPGLLKQQLNAL